MFGHTHRTRMHARRHGFRCDFADVTIGGMLSLLLMTGMWFKIKMKIKGKIKFLCLHFTLVYSFFGKKYIFTIHKCTNLTINLFLRTRFYQLKNKANLIVHRKKKVQSLNLTFIQSFAFLWQIIQNSKETKTSEIWWLNWCWISKNFIWLKKLGKLRKTALKNDENIS